MTSSWWRCFTHALYSKTNIIYGICVPDCENPGIAIYRPDWQKVLFPQSKEVPFTLLMENVNTSRVFLVKDDSYRKTMSRNAPYFHCCSKLLRVDQRRLWAPLMLRPKSTQRWFDNQSKSLRILPNQVMKTVYVPVDC